MQRKADLNPPLGKPGGPCQVVRRIEDEVKNPSVQNQLTDKVEDGGNLSNPEAAKVYDISAEKTKGLVSKLYIGPHAQYRMDLRSVSIRDLKDSIMEMGKDYHAAKKSGDLRNLRKYESFTKGQTLEFVTRKGLQVVLAPHQGGAKLVTTYWKGRPDPSPPGACDVRVARRYLESLCRGA